MSGQRRAGVAAAAAVLGPALLAALALPVRACPLGPEAGTVLGDAAGVQLAWKSEPARIPSGQPFVLRVALCPAGARLLAVDATMPEHGHGMNYRTSLRELGPGRWEVQGLLWHMNGRWELRFDVAPPGGGARQSLRHSVVLK